MQEDIVKAEELFFKYGASPRAMLRNGVYELYQSYQIPLSVEKIWLDELQTICLQEINEGEILVDEMIGYVSLLLSTVRIYKTIEVIPRLTTVLARKMLHTDSFSKLLLAEDLQETVYFLKMEKEFKDHDIIQSITLIAMEMLYDVLHNPVTVNARYHQIDYMTDFIDEKNILHRARRNVKKIH